MNHRNSIREIAEYIVISDGACRVLLSYVLCMKYLTQKFVPKFLNFDQLLKKRSEDKKKFCDF